jgi:phage terminase small subunit
MKGRPRKPAAVKILEGTFRQDRDGDPENLPGTGEPAPAEKLRSDAAAFWNEHVPRLIQEGRVKADDGPALTAMCQFWGTYLKLTRRESRTAVTAKLYPRVSRVRAMAFDRFKSLAATFGLTPSDRAKLGMNLGGTRKTGGVARRKRGA